MALIRPPDAVLAWRGGVVRGVRLSFIHSMPRPRVMDCDLAAEKRGGQHVLMPNDEPLAEIHELVVDESGEGMRLDSYLARSLPEYSRVHLRRVINAAGVQVDGRRVKAAHHLKAGQRVSIRLPEIPRDEPVPEAIPLKLLFEDEFLAVVNKPAGMVVHPGKGNWSGTLTAALAYHFEQLSAVGGRARPGIVHRLDRDTSGAIVIAKDDQTHAQLARQFEQRTVEKQYFAIVSGNPDRDRDWIDRPIGRHPTQREKMAVLKRAPSSREARSFYEVVERFDGFSSVRVFPKTGRTHQIRVHLGSIGCPVLCDRQYGGRRRITRGEIRRDENAEPLLSRQALHAERLAFCHPKTGDQVEFEAPLPEDLARLLDELKAYRSAPSL